MHRTFVEKLNEWGRTNVPFLFLIDFEQQKPHAWRLDEIDPTELLYSFNGVTNAPAGSHATFSIRTTHPISFPVYQEKFEYVQRHLERGDSFLTNLTVKTPIEVVGSLRDCFFSTQARYRFWLKNQLVFFSPEIFVQVRDGRIKSFPMKGTIDASILNARKIILQDEKETAEHVTMVDLIRNDLSQVASQVDVNRFRYIDEVKSAERLLLQVSSEIEGMMLPEYVAQIGSLLDALLPAGSVSGAPKTKTCEIIAEAEGEPRGYYTGIAGIFDGMNLDACVVIRFIEQQGERFFYRSGGGITNQSDARMEYDEALKKIYVPVN